MPSDPPTAHPAPEIPMDLRHNQFAFGGDSFFFNVGVNFIPVTTVLTALVAQLTPNKTLVGAVSMAWTVGWLAPQLLAARMVRGKVRT